MINVDIERIVNQLEATMPSMDSDVVKQTRMPTHKALDEFRSLVVKMPRQVGKTEWTIQRLVARPLTTRLIVPSYSLSLNHVKERLTKLGHPDLIKHVRTFSQFRKELEEDTPPERMLERVDNMTVIIDDCTYLMHFIRQGFYLWLSNADIKDPAVIEIYT